MVAAPRAEKPRLWRVGALAALPPRPEAGAEIERSGGAAAVEVPTKPRADRHPVSPPTVKVAVRPPFAAPIEQPELSTAPPEAATAPPAGPAIRRGRVRRVQVERIVISRGIGSVAFNDGIEASAPRGELLERLRAVERRGEMIDAELADYGAGWIVESVEPPSAQWSVLEVRAVC